MAKPKWLDLYVGFIAGSWIRTILQSYPVIDSVQYIDHWKNNREIKGLLARLKKIVQMKKQVLKYIGAVHSDTAGELYSYLPVYV